MPRTILEPEQGSSEHDLRSAAEEGHWTQQEKLFSYPLLISPPKVSWRPPYSAERTRKTLDQLSPDDCRMFCFKDCALYVVSVGQSNRWWQQQLYDKIYRYWFPSRAQDTDISHGNFFCHAMDYPGSGKSPSPTSIKEVLSFHMTLCQELDQLIPQIPEELSIDTRRSHSLLVYPPAVYRLRPTFKRCFIVIHAEYEDHSIDSQDMKDRGVVIVWPQEEDAARHGCVADSERGIRVENCGDLGRGQAFRCDSLECAMRLVLATDPQRSTLQREQHGYYTRQGIEWLDQSEPLPVETCRCMRCRPHMYKTMEQMKREQEERLAAKAKSDAGDGTAEHAAQG